jgi:hypothetical protein
MSEFAAGDEHRVGSNLQLTIDPAPFRTEKYWNVITARRGYDSIQRHNDRSAENRYTDPLAIEAEQFTFQLITGPCNYFPGGAAFHWFSWVGPRLENAAIE